MKDVLISTQPEWVAKICNEIYKRADGTPVYEKEIEVRKTRPKQEVPFRCFIYCTKAKEDKYILERLEDGVFTRLDGKVIGEFICDRIDNNKGYSPDNCRFVTAKENSLNRRNSIRLTIDGETKTVEDWGKIKNKSIYTIYWWVRVGGKEYAEQRLSKIA